MFLLPFFIGAIMAYSLLEDLENDLVIEQEVRNILNTFFDEAYESSEHFNFRCNVCGDSQNNKFKKRGYILKTRKPWLYYCHNCGYSKSVRSWMKIYFPSNYRSMMDAIYRGEKPGKDIPSYKNIKSEKPKLAAEDEKLLIKTFKKAEKFPFVVEYCESRKIPKSVYSKWFFAEEGSFENRLIIPFYDKDGKVYYYQGRAMYSWMLPKYKSRKGSGFNNIYNYYFVNKENPVAVLEGPIDSIFVDNSVGVTGLKINDKRLAHFPNRFFLLDNDAAGKKSCLKLLDKGEYVFNWQRFLSAHSVQKDVKDVNDFIRFNTEGIVRLTYSLMSDYITNSIADKRDFL